MVWGIGEDHLLDVVCHLAGKVDDALLASLTLDRFDDVMGPSGMELGIYTERLSIFLRGLFLSSIAGMLGNAGQANYAAANAALESLFDFGGKIISLRRYSLGPWAGGMVDDVLQNHLRSRASI